MKKWTPRLKEHLAHLPALRTRIVSLWFYMPAIFISTKLSKTKRNYQLHMGLHYQLKKYLIELKNYIHEKEKNERQETTTSSEPST